MKWESDPCKYLGKEHAGQREHKCKGPNMRECLVIPRKRKEVIMAWSQMNKEEYGKRWGWQGGPRDQIMGELVGHGKDFGSYSKYVLV